MNKSELTPTVLYFVELTEGNTALEPFETKALAWIKENNENAENNPPNNYFKALDMYQYAQSNITVHGSKAAEKAVNERHPQAVEYVKQQFPELKRTAGSTSNC